MDILEFVSSLQAVSPSSSWVARPKDDLAVRFGLPTAPPRLPFDVNQTFIPDRALDGFFAKEILSDPAIATEYFADYAATTSILFAALQRIWKNLWRGRVTGLLDAEHTSIFCRKMDPCLWRVAVGLSVVPFKLNWWPQSPDSEVPIHSGKIGQYIDLFQQRQSSRIEQRFNLIAKTPLGGLDEKVLFRQDGSSPMLTNEPHPPIGVLVLYKLESVEDYLLVLQQARASFLEQIVVLVYDRRGTVEQCLSQMSGLYPWQGITLKHLSYGDQASPEDQSILVFQGRFFPSQMRGHIRNNSL